MIIRALNENKDWTFGKGRASYKQEQDAIALNIETRINEWKNDCFFNKLAGVDWGNRLEFRQRKLFTNEIKSIILKSDGVLQLINFSIVFDRNNRNITITYLIQTIYSQSFLKTIELEVV